MISISEVRGALFALCLVCGALFISTVPVKGDQLPPQRDSSAIATMSAAIAALGGQSAVAQVADSVASGLSSGGNQNEPISFTWKTLGAEFRYEIGTGSNLQVFVSGYGTPANSQDGVVSQLPSYTALSSPPFHLPALVLSRELNDPAYTLIAMGSATLPDGRNVVQVRTISSGFKQYPPVTQQDWFFDPTTNTPLRVSYSTPTVTSPTDCVASATDFSNYQEISGLLVPLALITSVDDGTITVASVSGLTFNVGLSSNEFILGGGGQ